MFVSSRPSAYCDSSRHGYTFIELLAVMFIVASATMTYDVVRRRHGIGSAVGASTLAVLAGTLIVILLYRWSWSREKRQLAELREKYSGIFRIKALPTDSKSIVKPDSAEIRVGDYGWEARPTRHDGLVHLQGLTTDWKVVWHAAFRPDQIERVATKPCSQYDKWKPYWAKSPPPPPCGYPVQERDTATMGLPHHSGRYFTNYPSQNYIAAKPQVT